MRGWDDQLWEKKSDGFGGNTGVCFLNYILHEGSFEQAIRKVSDDAS